MVAWEWLHNHGWEICHNHDCGIRHAYMCMECGQTQAQTRPVSWYVGLPGKDDIAWNQGKALNCECDVQSFTGCNFCTSRVNTISWNTGQNSFITVSWGTYVRTHIHTRGDRWQVDCCLRVTTSRNMDCTNSGSRWWFLWTAYLVFGCCSVTTSRLWLVSVRTSSVVWRIWHPSDKLWV